MESRKITVIDTRENSVKTFESTAETMADMLVDFEHNGINAAGMAIQEGLTKTELNENSTLPHDVLYRGVVTNNLVFRLTLQEKKIKSGINRKTAYQIIKDMSLEDLVKEAYGRNFTQVPTEDLEKVINEHAPQETEKCALQKAFVMLVNILYDYDVIYGEDLDNLLNPLQHSNSNELYTKQELEEMFKNM